MARIPAIVAALILITLFAACHDEIPVQRDTDRSAAAQVPDSNSDWPWTPGNRQPSAILNWGVSEQSAGLRSVYVSYSVNPAGGQPWHGVDFTLSCVDGTVRTLSLSRLPWTGQSRATLLISLNGQSSRTEDVFLYRYTTYGPDDPSGEQASTQLDDSRWYEPLQSAKTLTIMLADSEMDPVAFDLTRLFGTPLQDEIDECTLPTAGWRSR